MFHLERIYLNQDILTIFPLITTSHSLSGPFTYRIRVYLFLGICEHDSDAMYFHSSPKKGFLHRAICKKLCHSRLKERKEKDSRITIVEKKIVIDLCEMFWGLLGNVNIGGLRIIAGHFWKRMKLKTHENYVTEAPRPRSCSVTGVEKKSSIWKEFRNNLILSQ